MSGWISWIILAVIAIAIVVVVAAYFYCRSTREVSLIRTGIGGRKVVQDGGVIAIPYFHSVTRVNMQTLRLEVRRQAETALITNDRMRVDIGAEFYVSVDTTADAIARASQTLGDRSFDSDKLRDLIEGKLVDALRTVAAKMTMDELHENRGDFVRQVAELLREPLSRNGLALDSVSLSALDQTPFAALDENNAFNAVGMRKLAEVISRSKKERAEIDSDAEVSVHRAQMEATRRKLEIDLEREQAEIQQTEALEILRAAQLAEIASRKAESEQSVNAARIRMEQQIREADIAREQAIREAEIAQGQALEFAEQDRAIAVANKTQDESKARAAADQARVAAVEAAEAIETARAIAEAQRRKQVAILVARQEDEIAAERRVVEARAAADAAAEDARRTLKDAEARAEAAKMQIASMKSRMAVEAEGQRALNEAENLLNAEVIELRRDLARLDAMPGIVKQMVKPAKKIDSIRINHLGGGIGATGAGDTGKAPMNQAIDSIMEMALQFPALKKIGEELGISVEEGIAGIVGDRPGPKPSRD